jgi:hypothetical protein
LDHDAKLQEFLAIKGQQRLNTEQQEREADKKKKRIEEMERQFNEYDKIYQRIIVSTAIYLFYSAILKLHNLCRFCPEKKKPIK